MSYSQIVAENIRLTVLLSLEEDPGYSHNEQVLRMMLAAVGHDVSHDRLRAELCWLEEQGLVRLSGVSGLTIAKLTNRGEDVALGRAHIPGVARPGPGA